MSDSNSAKTPVSDPGSDDTIVETSTELDGLSDDRSASDVNSFLRAVAETPRVVPRDAEPDRIGAELGKYRISGEIGRGGMGIVYAAEDTKLRRRVALKVLPEAFAADPERRQRFLREARAASAITHRNIATVFDVDEASDGCVYLAMELVEGRTLRALLEQGALSVREARRLAREILEGLSKAHEVGIIHRDLKPDNVMVTPDGSVKLLDFGLAKPIGASETLLGDETTTSSDVATMEGRILGTPSYMSPEQAKGEAVDQRSDIFSFGIVLYEMLTGRRPFVASGKVALLIAIDRDRPPPLGRLAPRARPLERLVHKCLAKKPEDRFGSCDELMVSLDSTRDSVPVRRRVALIAVGIAMVSAIGLWWTNSSSPPPVAPKVATAVPREVEVATPTRQALDASSATPSAEPSPGRSRRTSPVGRSSKLPAPSATPRDPLEDQK